jgi:allantoate deiminase
LSLAEAWATAGLDSYPPRVAEDDFVSAFIEVHIDQGTLLSGSGMHLGVVDTIAGVNRTQLTWVGEPSHSGGRRRSERRDALIGAAEFLTALDGLWGQLDSEEFVQITVGQLNVEPNSPNTVPGVVRAILDLRALKPEILDRALVQSLGLAEQLAGGRQLRLVTEDLGRLEPMPMDSDIGGALKSSAEALGLGADFVPSFAGHDSMILAKRFPSSMLLVANPSGMSHSPEESYDKEGLRQAIAVALDTVPTILTRTRH